MCQINAPIKLKMRSVRDNTKHSNDEQDNKKPDAPTPINQNKKRRTRFLFSKMREAFATWDNTQKTVGWTRPPTTQHSGRLRSRWTYLGAVRSFASSDSDARPQTQWCPFETSQCLPSLRRLRPAAPTRLPSPATHQQRLSNLRRSGRGSNFASWREPQRQTAHDKAQCSIFTLLNLISCAPMQVAPHLTWREGSISFFPFLFCGLWCFLERPPPSSLSLREDDDGQLCKQIYSKIIKNRSFLFQFFYHKIIKKLTNNIQRQLFSYCTGLLH